MSEDTPAFTAIDPVGLGLVLSLHLTIKLSAMPCTSRVCEVFEFHGCTQGSHHERFLGLMSTSSIKTRWK